MSSSTSPHYEADVKKVKPQGTGWIFEPRGLNVVWGNDNRYWRIPDDKANQDDIPPAELVQVSWLEVTGSLENLKPGRYEISFKVTLKSDAFGWTGCPVFLMAKIGKKGRFRGKKISLPDQSDNNAFEIPQGDDKFEIEVKASESDNKLYFGLYEVWSGKWKGGLQLHNASVRKVP